MLTTSIDHISKHSLEGGRALITRSDGPLSVMQHYADRVYEVLRELRQKGCGLDTEVNTLERVLRDPLFRQYSYRASSAQAKVHRYRSNNNNAQTPLTPTERVEKVKKAIERSLRQTLTENQKLYFADIGLADLRPEVVITHEAWPRLIIIGPKDIKSRSGGRLRVADRIVALGTQLYLKDLVETAATTPAEGSTVAGDDNSRDKTGNVRRSTDAEQKEEEQEENEPQKPCDAAPVEQQSSSSSSAASPTQHLRPQIFDEFTKQLDDAEASRKHLVFAVVRDTAQMVLTGDWTQVEIIQLPNDPSVGLGFGIVGGTSTGVVVKTILPGSAADKDKRLRAGDHILQIGRMNVHGMSSQQVATILRQQDSVVELVVGRSINTTESAPITPHCWIMSTRAALSPTALQEQINTHLAKTHPGNGGPPAATTTANSIGTPSTSAQPPCTTEASAHPKTSETTVICHHAAPTTSSTLEHEQEDHESDEAKESRKLEKSISDVNRSQHNQVPKQSSSNSSSASTRIDQGISLKSLQEMALTTFCCSSWVAGKYESVEVELERDPVLGLGITVAGYVHKKEEISGVFVKSLVPNSSAHLSKGIKVHDLIIEVNGRSIERLSHADSVRMLIKSGNKVRLKMIRFAADSPQALCLKMLQEQETESQRMDSQNASNVDYVAYWKNRLGSEFDVVLAEMVADKSEDGGLGLSLEGTVDVVDGAQLCPHHYIESMRNDGPGYKGGMLKTGDELLQVNDEVLFGRSHITVRQSLTRAASTGKTVRLYVARKAQQVNLFVPSSPEQSLPQAYPLLASTDDRIVKAKSEINLQNQKETTWLLEQVSNKLRSRSLEPITGLAIWNCVPMIVQLEKDAKGLGFSVADYQDPVHPGDSVIVIRSLVPGGAAQADGRIVPGDRLLFVNGEDLSNCSLDRAVSVLKAAPLGLVRLGIAKPVPIDQCRSHNHSPIISRSERVLAKGSSPRSQRRKQIFSYASSQEDVWIGPNQYRSLYPQAYYPSSGSCSPSVSRARPLNLNGSSSSMISWSPCSTRSLSPCGSPLSLKGSWAYDVVYLPSNLERSIKVIKGALPLGVTLDAEIDKGVNGCVVKSICSKKAFGQDGRIQTGDYLVKINNETLRNVTSAQARAILKRTNLIGTQINITYITAADAKLWKQRFHRENEPQSPVINRLSPKVFPKFYKSPFMGRKELEPCTSTEEQAKTVEEEIPKPLVQPEVQTEPPDTELLSEEEEPTETTEPFEFQLDNLALELTDAALKEAYVELLIANATPDWKGRETPVSESERKLSTPKSPAESTSTSRGSPEKQAANAVKYQVPAEVHVEGKTTTPPTTSTVMRSEKTLRRGASSEMRRSDMMVSPTVSPRSLRSPLERANTLNALRKASLTVESHLSKTKSSKFWGDARTVVLHREPNTSFGISIVGGRVEVSQKGGLPGTGNTVSGIFIKSVLPNSPAGKSGSMNMGDRVISVNEIDLRDATHEYAVQVIKNAANPVKFVVQSLQSFSTTNESVSSADSSQFSNVSIAPNDSATANHSGVLARKIVPIDFEGEPTTSGVTQQPSTSVQAATSPDLQQPSTSKRASTPSVTGEETPVNETNAEEDEEKEGDVEQVYSGERRASGAVTMADLRGRKVDPREMERRKIERNSAAYLQRLPDDPEEEDRFFYTKNKILRKYGDLPGEPILMKLEEIPPGGLGLSLSGNRDRDKMSVFVIAIKSTSKLPLQIGDELLEINGKVLFGLSHVNASTKIRECCEKNELELLILRRPDAVEEMAVRPDDQPSTSAKTPDTSATKTSAEAPSCSGPDTTAKEMDAKDGSSAVPPSSSTSGDSTLTASAATLENIRKKSWQMERTIPVETGKETLIEIDKDGKGLGLSIVGGSDTVLNTVVIHEVYPDGAAAMDGRLKPGDQVLEVHGVSLRGVSHDQAISLLRRTPSKVRLLVYRDVELQMSLLDPTQIYNIFEMELTKKPGRGLGLSIVGRKNEPGVYVSEVVKGGAAEADSRLMQGDQILAVNGQDVTGSMQEDVAAMLKTCSGKVTLKVGRWKLTETTNKVHAATPPTIRGSCAGTPSTSAKGASNRQDVSPASSSPFSPEDERKDVPPPAPASRKLPKVTIQEENQQQATLHSDLSPVTEEPSSGTDQDSLTGRASHHPPKEVTMLDIHEEHSDDFLIELKKIPDQQLGMGIGKRVRGILVTSLQPGSTAAEKLRVGDRLMAVNGVAVTDQGSAVNLVKASGERLILQIARPRGTPSA
uniref:PDZ domain-containing protein n=1 Tax=Steinernema glaseri TaxID=37863 RepID=A0A1I8AVQ8_9BILA